MDDKTVNFDPYATREAADLSLNDASPETRVHGDSDTGHGSGSLEVRCPNCHVPMKVAADTALTDLTCSSCGSHFSLVDEVGATRLALPLATLGRFELISRLGMGAFGAVWKARDKELDRTVAIKIPRQGALSGADQEQFFREARAAAQLRHPNIVSVHEVGRDGDSVYIVSDFVRGVTLGDWLTGQQPTNREAAELCAKIGDALHHAHEQGVVHRDLKPANIMIDGEGQPHIMDFGLARREVGEVTVTMEGQVLGTPAYMSPEQAQGEAHSADRRSDVYSLGVILFQLLTGELPFRGNARMLMHQVIHDEPPSPRKLNANVSKDLETITLKCLEKEPARRYQSAQELADEFRRVIVGKPILSRPVRRIETIWRWSKRNPSAAIATIMVGALLIGSPIVAFYQRSLRKAADDSALAARRTAYVAHMSLAFDAFKQPDVGRLFELLESERPAAGERDLRGFEWHYLWANSHRERVTRPVPSGVVNAMTFSSDGKLFATLAGNEDSSQRELCIWDAKTVTAKQKIWNLPGTPTAIQFTSASIAAVSSTDVRDPNANGDIILWDVNNLRKVGVLTGHKAGVSSMAKSLTGDLLASAGWDHAVRVWDLKSLKCKAVLTGCKAAASCVAFSPDAKLIACGTGVYMTGIMKEQNFDTKIGEVYIWKTGTNELVHTFKDQWGPVAALAFSPDGKILVAATGSWDSPGALVSWNTTDWSERNRTSAHCKAIGFPPRGDFFVSGDSSGGIGVWDVDSMVAKNYFLAHNHWINAIHFSPDGKTVVSVSGGRWGHGGGEVKLWDVDTIEHSTPYVAALSPIRCVAPANESVAIATGHYDGTVRVWDRSHRQLRKELCGHKGRVFTLCWYDHDTMLASGSEDGTIILWDADNGAQHATFKTDYSRPAFNLDISPDGQLMAVCAGDSFDANQSAVHPAGTVSLWNVQSRQRVGTLLGHDGYVNAVHFSSNGSLLFSGGGYLNHGEVFVWNVKDRQQVGALDGHTNPVYGVAVSNDGKLLATGASDMTVCIWNISNRRLLHSMKGHNGTIYACSFSPDGKTLATGSWDQRVMLWNVDTGEPIGSPSTGGGIKFSTQFASDGSALFATGESDFVSILEADHN